MEMRGLEGHVLVEMYNDTLYLANRPKDPGKSVRKYGGLFRG
jgi:hypothetical protein